MELIGKLKENVEKAENREEAKKIIKDAGLEAGISHTSLYTKNNRKWQNDVLFLSYFPSRSFHRTPA